MNDLCPHCERELDAASAMDGGPQRPEAGDLSVCLYCAGVSVFTGEGLIKRLPTKAELAEIDGDSRIAAAQRVVRATWESR